MKTIFSLLIFFSCCIQTYAQDWNELMKVVPSDRFRDDHFGKSVSIFEDYIIVGAEDNDTDISGNNYKLNAGAAYVFKKDNNSNWGELQKIVASDRDEVDRFGSSLSIYNNFIIVGARTATLPGVPYGGGAAYIFEKNEIEQWEEFQRIESSDIDSWDLFGISVDINDNCAIVGASGESVGVTTAHGAAYIFYGEDDEWNQIQKIVSSDLEEEDEFGYSVVISEDVIIIGAPEADHNQNGNVPLSEAGSAYFFEDITTNKSRR